MRGTATPPQGLIPTPHLRTRGQGEALPAPCVAQWQATLALMTAYGREISGAGRLLLARQIERNLTALAAESAAAAPAWHDSFERLGRRWRRTSQRLAAEPAMAGQRLRRAKPGSPL